MLSIKKNFNSVTFQNCKNSHFHPNETVCQCVSELASEYEVSGY